MDTDTRAERSRDRYLQRMPRTIEPALSRTRHSHVPISATPAPDTAFEAGPSCRRSRLSPRTRLIIFFGVLFPLKYALPYTGLSAAAQVIALVAVATGLVGAFWFACGEGRRGGLLLVAMLWIAAIIKISVQ
jgi:hypothetical protein